MLSSLEITDTASNVVEVAPRVSLSDIEAAVGGIYYTTAHAATNGLESAEHVVPLSTLTLCIVVMRNGFTVIGKSAPASPENFNADLGRKFAYEDAVRQIWPMMGFSLRDRLAS